MRNVQRLAARLLHAGTAYTVPTPELSFDVRDTLVQLHPNGLRLYYEQGELPIKADDEVLAVLARCPEAIWVCNADGGTSQVRLVPFAPPRVLTLATPAPIRVDESLTERLGDYRFRIGDDLLRRGCIRVGQRSYAVIGQRTLATLDDREAMQLTWWLPSGGCLELLIVLEGDQGWLQLVDFVREADSRKANCQPTALLRVAPGGSVRLVNDTTTGPAGPLRDLRPERSAIFESWARYRVIQRIEQEGRETARAAHPLHFAEGGQVSGRGLWRAAVKGSPEALRAWLGADAREDRDTVVEQSVRLKDDPNEVSLLLSRARLTSPGTATVTLQAEAGVRLPSNGTLLAQENRGSRAARDREEDALQRLMSGRSACERLLTLLIDPGQALPPEQVRLSLALMQEPLPDPHQQRAIQLILGCVDIVGVQGPPGTGKTRVIVEALRQLAARRSSDTPLKVLISSVQNEAIANVVQRLGDTEGIQVRWVRRRGRTEDEKLRFSRQEQAAQREVITGLEARLTGSPVVDRLTVIRGWLAELNNLRAVLAGGEGARQRIAETLNTLASDDRLPLTSLLQEEARAMLPDLLTPKYAAAVESGDAHAAPPPLPDAPEGVAAWWQAARPAWPAEHTAQTGALVQELAESVEGAASNPRRYQRRVERGWQALRQHINAIPAAAPPAPTSAGPTLEERLDAWVATASAMLKSVAAQVDESPEAVTFRFLETLRANPSAWGDILQRHGDTVAATCSMSAKAAEAGESYDWVIIDEAGRASPFELLVPMVQGQRVVLIGDHRQLPPTVDDALARRAGEGEESSRDIRYETLFGELFALLPAANRGRLAIQYRMHGDIGAAVDQLFYRPHQEPITSFFSGERAAQKAPVWGVLGDRALAWVDVATRQRRTEHNPEEAEAVLDLLERYVAGGAGPDTVGVICGYRQQRDLLRSKLESRPALKSVALLVTIDAVQGREYPAVILCLVRSDGRPGFLASPNRINVAISRAQQQLIIVGDTKRMGSRRMKEAAPHLPALLTLCRDAHVCKPLGEY